MKKSDFFSIVLVAAVGMIATFFLGQWILGNPDEQVVTYKTVEPISAELVDPDAELFNADAVNPTVEVYVGDCEDVDRNGIIDQAELVACGKVVSEGTNDEAASEESATDNAASGESATEADGTARVYNGGVYESGTTVNGAGGQ